MELAEEVPEARDGVVFERVQLSFEEDEDFEAFK